MDRNEFLNRVAAINVWRRGDSRAPHKPLLLLLALGRVTRGEARLAGYGSDVEQQLTVLLERFGRPRVNHHPDQPYCRLPKDGLWEVPGIEDLPLTRGGTASVPALRETVGGFPDAAYELLRGDPTLVENAVRAVLDAHFPPSLHSDIRGAVGLPDYLHDPARAEDPWTAHGPQVKETTSTARDPRFRRRVLRAYERRCAVCDFDVRIEDQLLGLEAAHIKWHAAGGPDRVPNGLAMCSFHHKALDIGALGLEKKGRDVAVLISSEVNGRSEAVRQLRDLRGVPLRRPQGPELAPDVEFVAWHRREVFREPALGAG